METLSLMSCLISMTCVAYIIYFDYKVLKTLLENIQVIDWRLSSIESKLFKDGDRE